MMVHDTKKNSQYVQMMFSLFHPLCIGIKSYLAGDTEEKSRISLTFCVVGSHPAQIYLIKDCEVELTLYLHFVLDFLYLMYSTPLNAVLCSAFWSPC